ncbi:MAG: radical SAM protein [Desulfobacterales bacterium]|nr:radical SAM protein [Desulfobacterales bacterium]
MALLVNEIFYSIQGESIYSGRPCIFVRLSGCNLRCTYCDTQYAYEKGEKMEIDHIIRKVSGFKCRWVEVTGGEPLIQSDTPMLVSKLLDNGYVVMMETNGSLDISRVDPRCIKVLDIKCPSSNESKKIDVKNLKKLRSKDQIKFVIGNHEDYTFAKNIISSHCPDFPGNRILFSPVYGKMPTNKLAEWILKDHLNVRLHLQIHKYIWPDKEKGI